MSVMSDKELTEEEKEELRLARTMEHLGQPRRPMFQKKREEDARREEDERKASIQKAKDQASKQAKWKADQERKAKEAEERLKYEKAVREQKIHSAPHIDATPSGLTSATQEEEEAERLLQALMKGEVTADDPRVQRALLSSKDRLHDVFKVHHSPTKTGWAKGISEEGKKRLDGTADAEIKALEEQEKEDRKKSIELRKLQEQLCIKRIEERNQILAEKKAYYANATGAPHLSDLELAVAEEILILRSSPKVLGDALESKRAKCFDENVLQLTDEHGFETRLLTREGVAAVYEASQVLRETKPLPALEPSAGLTRAMYEATVKNPKQPNALELITKYGKVAGSARQVMYKGPFGTAQDALLSILTDDGNPKRTRQGALLDPSFTKFGVCAGNTEDGEGIYVWLVLATHYEDKQ